MYTINGRVLTANTINDLTDGISEMIIGYNVFDIVFNGQPGVFQLHTRHPQLKRKSYKAYYNDTSNSQVITCSILGAASCASMFYIKNVVGQVDRNTILVNNSYQYITESLCTFLFHLIHCRWTAREDELDTTNVTFAWNRTNIYDTQVYKDVSSFKNIKLSILEILTKLFGAKIANSVCKMVDV